MQGEIQDPRVRGQVRGWPILELETGEEKKGQFSRRESFVESRAKGELLSGNILKIRSFEWVWGCRDPEEDLWVLRMQWGTQGVSLTLSPKLSFGVSFEGVGDENRGSGALKYLFGRNVLPLGPVLEWKPSSPIFSWQGVNLRVSEPEITLFIPLPPCPTAFQSFQPHQSQFYFEYEKGLERDVCPPQIALWKVRRRRREARSGSVMPWWRETEDYTGLQGVRPLNLCSSKCWTPVSVWWLY